MYFGAVLECFSVVVIYFGVVLKCFSTVMQYKGSAQWGVYLVQC